MILKRKGVNGNKSINIHYCDFCHTTYPESILITTENMRYDIDCDDFGREAVCRKCLGLMTGIAHSPVKSKK